MNHHEHNNKEYQYHPTRSAHSRFNNWDEKPHNNVTTPTTKGKQVDSNNQSEDALLNKITHLETIIKDLSSQVKGLDIIQKEQKKDIKILQEQEKRHANNMEKLNQQLTTINKNMVEQNQTISSVPRIVDFLDKMEQSGFFTQFDND